MDELDEATPPEPQRTHFPDATYTDHPQHQPQRHPPVTTAATLVQAALTKGANDELKSIGDRYGSMPFTSHETKFLAELVMLLIAR